MCGQLVASLAHRLCLGAGLDAGHCLAEAQRGAAVAAGANGFGRREWIVMSRCSRRSEGVGISYDTKFVHNIYIYM